jgi:hypothetical protein
MGGARPTRRASIGERVRPVLREGRALPRAVAAPERSGQRVGRVAFSRAISRRARASIIIEIRRDGSRFHSSRISFASRGEKVPLFATMSWRAAGSLSRQCPRAACATVAAGSDDERAKALAEAPQQDASASSASPASAGAASAATRVADAIVILICIINFALPGPPVAVACGRIPRTRS